jgi:hypothetical protein
MLEKREWIFIAICLWLSYVAGKQSNSKTIKQEKQDSRKHEKRYGEKCYNCSCPSDAFVEEAQMLCGYDKELKYRSSSTNLIKNPVMYRYFDPYRLPVNGGRNG